MAVSNIKQNWSDEYYTLLFEITAVNDSFEFTLPTPMREYTLQRALGSGVTAATVLAKVTQSFDDATFNVTAGTANSDAPVSASSHALRRARALCSVFTGTGTVQVAFVCRRVK